MEWFFPAILALVLWGSGQIFIKRGLSGISPFVSNLIATIFAIIIEVPFALIGGVNWSFFPLVFLFGFLAQIPNYAYPYAIDKASISLSGTVLAIYPLFTVLLSITFLGETLNYQQVFGIVAILAGMFLVAKPEKESFKFSSWVVWALVAAILIGTGDFIGKVAITKFDLYSFILAFTLGGIPSVILIRIFDKSPIKVEGNRKDLLYSSIGNFIMPLGLLFLYIAFSKGPASLASPIASSYPALTAVLAYYFLKEKITKTNFAGIILATAGIILIGA